MKWHTVTGSTQGIQESIFTCLNTFTSSLCVRKCVSAATVSGLLNVTRCNSNINLSYLFYSLDCRNVSSFTSHHEIWSVKNLQCHSSLSFNEEISPVPTQWMLLHLFRTGLCLNEYISNWLTRLMLFWGSFCHDCCQFILLI